MHAELQFWSHIASIATLGTTLVGLLPRHGKRRNVVLTCGDDVDDHVDLKRHVLTKRERGFHEEERVGPGD